MAKDDRATGAAADVSEEEDLVGRVRRLLAGRDGVVEQPMFGGVAFMVRGHMACGALRGSLVVRLDEDAITAALAAERHVEQMDFTGRTIKTMALVRPPGIRGEAVL